MVLLLTIVSQYPAILPFRLKLSRPCDEKGCITTSGKPRKNRSSPMAKNCIEKENSGNSVC